MSDVTLSYKGSDILELSDSGSATLKTGGKYCEDDIEVEYVKPSGGGSGNTQGFHNVVFDYTNSDGRSWGGVVEDNTVTFSGSVYCSPPLFLRQPISISTNDVIELKITNSNWNLYSDACFLLPFVYLAGRTHPSIMIASNVPLANGSKKITYTGEPVVVNQMAIYARGNATNNLSLTLGLSINDEIIF